jgi:aspartate/methionine/tyrosine aminotransferase
VVIGPGAKPIIFASLLATAEAGVEVLVPDPGYPVYASATAFTGATPVGYRVSVESPAVIDVAEVAAKITPRTRVLVLNSPHNPTGTVLPRATLEGLAELVLKHRLIVISDEIYERFVFGVPHFSIASLPGLAERTIVVDGFSKTYSMTGWRLGYGLAPKPLVEPLVRLITNSVSCTNTAVQLAGIAALGGSQVPIERYVAEVERRRGIVTRLLNGVPGIECTEPSGAFYAFPKVRGLLDRLRLTSSALASALLQEAHVALLSGTAFGPGGEGYLRLSLASSERTLVQACQRINQWVLERQPAPAHRS